MINEKEFDKKRPIFSRIISGVLTGAVLLALGWAGGSLFGQLRNPPIRETTKTIQQGEQYITNLTIRNPNFYTIVVQGEASPGKGGALVNMSITKGQGATSLPNGQFSLVLPGGKEGEVHIASDTVVTVKELAVFSKLTDFFRLTDASK